MKKHTFKLKVPMSVRLFQHDIPQTKDDLNGSYSHVDIEEESHMENLSLVFASTYKNEYRVFLTEMPIGMIYIANERPEFGYRIWSTKKTP